MKSGEKIIEVPQWVCFYLFLLKGIGGGYTSIYRPPHNKILLHVVLNTTTQFSLHILKLEHGMFSL
jgi:hypothetical protein